MAGQIVRTASAVLFFFNALFFRFKLYYAVLSAMQGQVNSSRWRGSSPLQPARRVIFCSTKKAAAGEAGHTHSLALFPHFAANSKER